MTRSAATVLALLGLSLAFPRDAAAWCQLTTSRTAPTPGMPCVTDGIPLRWLNPCPSYAVDRRGAMGIAMADLRAALARSVSAWTEVTCPTVSAGFFVMQVPVDADCNRAEFNERGGNVSTIAFINDWSTRGLDPAAFAVTKVWHSTVTGEILDADILVNQSIRPWAVCPATGCPEDPFTGLEPVDVENVLTHEFGHFFGLAHTDDADATMYATTSRGELVKRDLGADDEAGFCAMYPPGSLTGTCELRFFGGDDLTCGSSKGGLCHAAPYAETTPPWALGVAIAGLLLARRRRRAKAAA